MIDSHNTHLKRCTKCGIEKVASAEFFHKTSRNKNGLRECCRDCRASEYSKNRDVEREKRRKFYSENRERLTEISRQYYRDNTDRQKEMAKKRWLKNRDRNISLSKIRQAIKRDEYLAHKRKYSNDRFRDLYKKEINFTLKHRTLALLRTTLKRFGAKKSARMIDLLGYDLSDLRSHLESKFRDGMTWERFMSGEIHIDHIRPVSSFNISSDRCEEFKECWSLSNLQPLWAIDNLKKGSKIDVS
jgi:hypothetical protein